MAVNQSIIDEFKAELVSTKKMIAAITNDILTFQPHEKSTTLKKLAIHIADIYSWYDITINHDELDFAKGNYKAPVCESAEDLFAYLEKSSDDALQVLLAANDDELKENWTMRNGEQIYFTAPKVGVVRTWCLNHLYHHRGQLTVYLRMLDVALPATYGTTADLEGK